MAVVWLILSLETGSMLHVGNFPNMDTCQTAATAAWSSAKTVTFTCVAANTGIEGEPGPPGELDTAMVKRSRGDQALPK
jgi:hypothetical protein